MPSRRRRPEVLGLEPRALLNADLAWAPDFPQVPEPSIPVLAPVTYRLLTAQADQTRLATRVGQTVTNRITATPSTPGLSTTYTIERGAPPGSQLDTRTGEFSWTPTDDQARNAAGEPARVEYKIRIRATENGPAASYEVATFWVTVAPAPAAKPTATPAEPAPSLTPVAFIDREAVAVADRPGRRPVSPPRRTVRQAIPRPVLTRRLALGVGQAARFAGTASAGTSRTG